MRETRPNLNTLINEAIRQGGETGEFEFKEVLDLTDHEDKLKLVKSIGAFANTQTGGFIFIGISNNREISGLSDSVADAYDQTRVSKNIVSNYLTPIPTFFVRQHMRDDGKRLVIIEIEPFKEVPSIVTRSEQAGHTALQAGTFLCRNGSAESALLTGDTEIRDICEAIAQRKAQRIVEIIQRGLIGSPGLVSPITSVNIVGSSTQAKPSTSNGLDDARKAADSFWAGHDPDTPYLDVFFSPSQKIRLEVSVLKKIFPTACIRTDDWFPCCRYKDPVSREWGWLSVIPANDIPDPKKPAEYVWVFRRDGAFLDRSPLWEDRQGSVIQGGVGLYHVFGQLVLLIRFLDRLGQVIGCVGAEEFVVGIRLANIRDRYLDNELAQVPRRIRGRATAVNVEAAVQVSLSSLRSARLDVVINLLEEVAWQFGRSDLDRQDFVNLSHKVPKHLGPEYAFPEEEVVKESKD